jgi:DNA-binding SARP family transcriptional activator
VGEARQIRLLGPVEVWCSGRRLAVGDRRRRTVLAALAVDANRLVTTDCLLDRVWGERAPSSARNALYGYLRKLRTTTGLVIRRASGGYLLEIDPPNVDLPEFTRLAAAARGAGHSPRAAELWAAALDKWQGVPLTGLDGEWVEEVRDALVRQHLSARLERNDVELRLGRHRELLDELRGLVAEHGLDERPLAQYLLAAQRSGRRAEAIEAFHGARRRFVDELGVEPSQETHDLYCRILRDEVDHQTPEPGPRFRVLGTLEFAVGAEWQAIKAPKWRALLAILLAEPGRVVSIDRIVAELWGDEPPASAVNLVHGYVARLRASIGGDVLVTRAPGYVLRVDPEQIDAGRFAAAVTAGLDTLASGEAQRAAEQLAAALALWRGPAFADVPGSPMVAAEGARLDELRLMAVEARVDADLAGGRHAEVITELRELTERHPLREQLWARLMAALHGAGRRAEALEVFAQVRHTLAAELGVDPGTALREQHRRILAEDAPSDEPDDPDQSGEPPDEPRPRWASAQLPVELPDLVGRDEQLAAAKRWLGSATPLIAVTGPGGVGKTAFAASLAARSQSLFPDGVLFAPAGESALPRLLAALGIPVADEQPKSPHDRAAMFWDLLGDRRVLIVLDDVPDESYVRPLLPAAGGCGLVVTSRRRLAGLDSFHALPLDVLQIDAGITLLRAIAGDGRVGRHAGSIVEACGGLPLAVKVAGARLCARPNWTAEDLARRLADTRSRLDWLQLGDLGVRTSLVESISGLTDDQRLLLRRLGLLDTAEFAGWATAALLDRDPGAAEPLLDDLVEAHLVEPAGHGVTGPRYRMHELIRLVAGELADDADVTATTRVRYGWLALAAAADDQLAHWFGLDPEPAPAWLPPADILAAVAADPMRWFGEEHDALVAAIRCRADTVAWALAQRMATYLEVRGHYDDWIAVLRAGLAAADHIHDRHGQATMLGLLMHAEANRDQHQTGMRYAALAFAAYQALDSPAPPFDSAPSVATPALEDARRRRDTLAVGFEACRLALALRLEGARTDYLALFEEARDAFRVGGVPLLELWTIKNTGLVYLRRRQFAQAEECLRRGHEIFRDSAGTIAAGGDLAGVAAAYGRTDLAEQLVTAAIAAANRTGDRWTGARALHTLADIRASRGDPGAARAYREALSVWTDLRLPHRIAQINEALTQFS